MAEDIFEYENLQEIEYGGLKIIVEAARRDSEGNTISTTYAKKNNVQEKLQSGVDIITINGQSVLRSGNIDVYTKSEVDTTIGNIKTIRFEIVEQLPQTGESNVIYLVPQEAEYSDAAVRNLYNEYIYVNNKWELIGRKEDNLNFKTINNKSILRSDGDPETNISVDPQIHLVVVNELPDPLSAELQNNVFYLVPNGNSHDIYGRLNSGSFVKINNTDEVNALADRVTALEQAGSTGSSPTANVDLSEINSAISDLEGRVGALEAAEPAEQPSGGSTITKLSELDNDVGFITNNITDLTGADLDEITVVGRYNITNATNYPIDGSSSGILKIENINGVLHEEWATDNIRAIRTGEYQSSVSDFDTNLTVSVETNGILSSSTFNGSSLELQAGRTYVLSGNLNGTITIRNASGNSEVAEDTILILNNVTILNNDPASLDTSTILYAEEKRKLKVFLKENTENYIINRISENSSVRNSGAAILSRNDLIITGTGGLSISSNTGVHGLKGSEVIIAGNPTLDISALHDCIHGSKTVEIQYGTIVLNNGNDGIEAKNSESTTGVVRILGGSITIKNCSTAISTTHNGIICGPLTSVEFSGNIQQFGGLGSMYAAPDVADHLIGLSPTEKARILKSKLELFGAASVCQVVENLDNSESLISIGVDTEGPYAGSYPLEDGYVYRIKGYVTNRLHCHILSGVELAGVEIQLDGAYIESDSDAYPTILYENDKKSLELKALDGTVNYVYQTFTGTRQYSNGKVKDYDAVKSENSLTVSGNGAIYTFSNYDDGFDATEVSLRGDGARYAVGCGLRGIKGTRLFIGGPKVDTSTITLPESLNKNHYTNIYALNNFTENDLEHPWSADIYCRNGQGGLQPTKGNYVVWNRFSGLCIVGTFGSYSALRPGGSYSVESYSSYLFNKPSGTYSPIYLEGTVLPKSINENVSLQNITLYQSISISDFTNVEEITFSNWRVFYSLPSISTLNPSKNYVLGFSGGRVGWLESDSINETPAEQIPEDAVFDSEGNVFVDAEGNYLVIGD